MGDQNIFDRVIEKVNETYEELKKLPTPKPERIGGTYYGSTQLFSRVGNHLDLIQGQPYISYGYGGSTDYSQMWGIRIGGAYKEEKHKELMAFIWKNKQALFDEGYAIIDDYGTNFSTYGIAKR